MEAITLVGVIALGYSFWIMYLERKGEKSCTGCLTGKKVRNMR